MDAVLKECTFWDRERLLTERNEGQAYYFAKTRHNGIGIFAKRRIRRGELILVEAPLLTISNDDKSKPEFPEKYIDKLDENEKEVFYSLHTVGVKQSNIFEVNEFDLRKLGTGLFMKMSRINHSCRPNSHYAWDPHRRLLTLYAQEDVEQDQEITVTYMDLRADWQARQAHLKNYFLFECKCELCVKKNGHESNNRRNETMRLRNEYAQFKDGAPHNALVSLKTMLSLYRDENMLYYASYVGEANEQILNLYLNRFGGQRYSYIRSLIADYARYTLGNYTICFGRERVDRDYAWIKSHL